MKLTYKQRLFGFIFIIFAVFSVCIIISEQREERKYRTEALESQLDGYVSYSSIYRAEPPCSERYDCNISAYKDTAF